MTVEERMRPVTTFKPELASLDMGSLNFGLYPMLNRFQDFKHEWEVKHPENTGIWYSKIPSEILRKSCVSVIRTQHGLSLNATIFLIYTISHILLIKVWLGHHSSFNSFLAFWVELSLILRIWRTWNALQINYLEMITSGRSWGQGRIRFSGLCWRRTAQQRTRRSKRLTLDRTWIARKF